MQKDYLNHLNRSFWSALAASLMVVTMALTTFFLAEPTIGHGQSDTKNFTIKQTITDETSFTVAPSNVTMNGSIAGVTGGTANGSTTFVVRSNNAAGYYVDIAFYNNGTANAMVGDNTGSESIHDFGGDVAGEPSYSFTASTAAQFAYTVNSANGSDVDQSFLDNGSSCNQGGGSENSNTCWKAPDTTAFRIIDRASASLTGATSTISFRVVVPSGATPAVTADTYTATATLSLYTK